MNRHESRSQLGIAARTMAFGMFAGNREFEAWRKGRGREAVATLKLSEDGDVKASREFRGPSAFGQALVQGMDWLEQVG